MNLWGIVCSNNIFPLGLSTDEKSDQNHYAVVIKLTKLRKLKTNQSLVIIIMIISNGM